MDALRKTSPSESPILSVVIPAHNSADTIARAVSCLESQGLPQGCFEAIVVDNGSSDGTSHTLFALKSRFRFLHVHTTDAVGVSAARNIGMSHARGRYIAFLDADDYLYPNTLGPAVSFFEDHYDDIDLVTYPMLISQNGKSKPHVREKVLTHTGIYDLSLLEYAFALVTNINVLVKNLPDATRFRENLSVHEDLCFALETLLPRQRLGFCKEGAYHYERGPTTVTRTKMAPQFHFEQTISFWEDLFARYQNEVPLYLQASYLNELNWKLRANLLFPRHLEGATYDAAVARIWSLLQRVDLLLIVKAPRMNVFLRDYFARHAAKQCLCTRGTNVDGFTIIADGIEVTRQDAVELRLCATILTHNTLRLVGVLRSPLFNYSSKPELSIWIDGMPSAITLHESPTGYNSTDELISRDWEFSCEMPLTSARRIEFTLRTQDSTLPLRVSTTDRCRFRVHNGILEFKEDCTRIQLEATATGVALLLGNAHSSSDAPSSTERKEAISESILSSLRKRAIHVVTALCPKRASIWLYYAVQTKNPGAALVRTTPQSCASPDARQALLSQYLHDAAQIDGIKRFLVAKGEAKAIEPKSLRHKILFLLADKVVTTDLSESTVSPFTKVGLNNVADLVNYRLCLLQSPTEAYLQLQAYCLPWAYPDVQVPLGTNLDTAYRMLVERHA